MKIFKAKNGKEFRLSGMSVETGQTIVTICWIETGKFQNFAWSLIEPYCPFEKQVVVEVKPKRKTRKRAE